MSEKLQVGIIGAGVIAAHHAKAFADIERARVAAVCDIERDRAEKLAAECDGAKVFTDYEKLVADPSLDAVTVALPPFLHEPATVAALEAGKHVLCEKPMARDADEAKRMVEAARATGSRLMVHYRRRYAGDARYATRLISEGALGRVYFIRSVGHRFRGRPFVDTDLGEWFKSKELSGGGVVADLVGYALDLILGILGFPEIASAYAATYQEIELERQRELGCDVEEFGTGLFRLADGATIYLEQATAANTAGLGEGLEFFGSEAGMTLGPLTITRADKEGKAVSETPELPADPQRVGSVGPVRQFVDALLDGKPFEICSGYEGYLVQRGIDAIYESAATGHEVPVGPPDLPPAAD